MELLEAFHRRRAVRAYTSRPVDEATVRTLLGAAVLAPTAMNAQPWAFAVVQRRAQLKRYSDMAKSMLLSSHLDEKTRHYDAVLKDESFNIFYDASTLVAIGVDQRGTYAEADCWLAAANLMLAACDAGLATCCIGFAVPVLNMPEVKAELGIAAEGQIVAPIIVGYAASSPPVVPRRQPRVVSWTPPEP